MVQFFGENVLTVSMSHNYEVFPVAYVHDRLEARRGGIIGRLPRHRFRNRFTLLSGARQSC
jgi:hypothetical protein